jgi:hypothetical protein
VAGGDQLAGDAGKAAAVPKLAKGGRRGSPRVGLVGTQGQMGRLACWVGAAGREGRDGCAAFVFGPN